jgi:hypothetical protein
MSEIEPVEYRRLAAEHRVTPESWHTFVRDVLAELWLAAYRAALDTPTEILEVPQGELTFLFDAQSCLPESDHEDRTIAAWGRSTTPDRRRDRSRLAGFLPNPSAWSRAGRDRGHLVAHAAGGDLDLNVFPQSAALNRGRTDAGRRWRAMERYAALNPGTPVFVRAIYDDSTWVPAALDHGLLRGGQLWCERFENR